MAHATDDPSLILPPFDGRRVLVAGDVMLDRFIDGDVRRISPEAPIPVFTGRHERQMLGGAGNVAANILSLGGPPGLVGAVGAGPDGMTVRHLAAGLGLSPQGLATATDRMTTVKTRFVAQGQQILRHDTERAAALAGQDRDTLLSAFSRALTGVSVVVLSDYGKGVLLDGMAAAMIGLAREAGCLVLVDPKGTDFGVYRGADYVTPNQAELAQATGLAVAGDEAVAAAARNLIDRFGFTGVLVTRGAQGMSLVTAEQAIHVAAAAREVFDVSGAGDTVVGVLSLGLAAGLEVEAAARIANVAAGIVVGKRGTAQVGRHELGLALQAGRISSSGHVVDAATAAAFAAAWKRDGLSVGFTNGCFDLLHAGHIALIEQARAKCDRLIVAVNADQSVRRLKGAGRPVNDQAARASILAALGAVDLVVIFEEDTPEALIKAISPQVLVKGADYTVDRIVGADHVLAAGGRVETVPLLEGRSTTATIARIAEG